MLHIGQKLFDTIQPLHIFHNLLIAHAWLSSDNKKFVQTTGASCFLVTCVLICNMILPVLSYVIFLPFIFRTHFRWRFWFEVLNSVNHRLRVPSWLWIAVGWFWELCLSGMTLLPFLVYVFKTEKSEYLDLLMLMALWDVQGEPFEDSSEATCKSSGI